MKAHSVSAALLSPLLTLACCVLFGCARPPGGAVHGVLQVRTPEQSSLGPTIDLPDFQIVLRRGSTESKPVPTGLAGNFVVPAGLPLGKYDLCYSGPGVTETCLDDAAEVKQAQSFVGPVFVEPKDRSLLHGRVTLADGSICVHHYPAFGVSADTWVVAVDGGGKAVSSKVRTNSSGKYAIFDAKPAAAASWSAQVRARCEASQAIAVAGSPRARVDLKFSNRSPQVRHLMVRQGTDVVEWAAAGATVDLGATAVDPDGDPLQYYWAQTGAQAFVPAGGNASWQLPAAEARFQAVVLVGDGRGGYDFHPADVSTGTEKLRFGGVVRDESGAPVGGVDVTVNGKKVRTNPTGGFVLDLDTKSERYVVNLHKVGYVLNSSIFQKPVQDAAFTLHTCPGQPFSPGQGGRLLGRVKKGREWVSTRYSVTLKPGSLQEEGGTGGPVPANLLGCAFPITPEETLPGDYTAVDAGGRFVYLESLGALWVELWDPATGKTYNLRPGATADMEIPVHPLQAGLPGTDFDFWSYDEPSGNWVLEGKALRSGGFYRAQARHFSVANVDIQFSDAACMRLHTDVSQLSLPYKLRITAPTTTGVPKTVTKQIEDDLSVIIRLPENKGVLLEVVDNNGNVINATWSQTVNSGAKVPGLANTNPSPPFDECNSDALIPPLPNLNNRTFLTYHLLEDFEKDGNLVTASQAANAYYKAIDPTDGKDTFCEWLKAGGFLPGSTDCAAFILANLRDDPGFAPDAQAFYKNDGDLGFGRAMFLKADGPPGNQNVFMFVSNHPSANDAVDNDSLIATVAMEYTPAPDGTGTRYTKFFVFDATGNRVNKAPLDPFGDKYVPDLCVMCHGGSPADEGTIHNGGTPVYPNEGRINARFLPFALETFVYPDKEDPTDLVDPVPFDRASQEPQFRLLNQALLSTGPSNANRELIHGWYGSGDLASFTLPAATQNSGFVPGNWSGNPNLYSKVVQPSCRTCHISFGLDWADEATFNAFTPSIQSRVCEQGVVMPQAFRTWKRFWESGNPHQPFLLKSSLPDWDNTQPCPQ